MVNKTNNKWIKMFLIFSVVASVIFASQIFASAAVVKSETYISGICGGVYIGPMSPISKINIKNEKPYKNATIFVEDQKTHKKVGEVISDNKGYFRIFLKPGTYILKPVNGKLYPKAKTVVATVKNKKLSYVFIRYDSGIR